METPLREKVIETLLVTSRLARPGAGRALIHWLGPKCSLFSTAAMPKKSDLVLIPGRFLTPPQDRNKVGHISVIVSWEKRRPIVNYEDEFGQ
jgi:hypothetical protein